MKQVLVSLALNYSFAREIWRGIVRYSYEHDRWALWPGSTEVSDEKIGGFDGIIGMFGTAAQGERIQQLGKPVVNVSNRGTGRMITSVLNDDRLIGEMAARYFLHKGFRQFIYYGNPELHYSNLRQDGFTSVIRRAGYQVQFHHPGQGTRLHDWLRVTPPSTALLCNEDNVAFSVYRACWELDIKIPQDIAILGVNNDETYCLSGTLGLSSIMLGSEKLGFEAARLLDQLMRGGVAPKSPVLIPPLNVVTRISTDIQSVRDEFVRKALAYIQDNLERNFQVEEMLDHLSVGRRTLERKFKEHLGHSPHHAITRARVEKAKRLLEATQLKMEDIAQRCGFSEARILYRNFRLVTGDSPARYRKSFR
ncbi:MAG: substrate-binding domain-containing protein [Opitutales bacterium]|nr:substrate-binding domain-containing protein [Opitutales bacterium]